MPYFKLSKTGSSHKILQQNFVAGELEENCDIGAMSVVAKCLNQPNRLSLSTASHFQANGNAPIIRGRRGRRTVQPLPLLPATTNLFFQFVLWNVYCSTKQMMKFVTVCVGAFLFFFIFTYNGRRLPCQC